MKNSDMWGVYYSTRAGRKGPKVTAALRSPSDPEIRFAAAERQRIDCLRLAAEGGDKRACTLLEIEEELK